VQLRYGLLFNGQSIVINANFEFPLVDAHADDIDVAKHDHHYVTRHVDAEQVPEGFSLTPLRQILAQLPVSQFEQIARALQLLEWKKTHRFCGCCGSPMQPHPNGELAMACTACDHHAYPRINPCVIVAITRGREILLARSHRFHIPMFSTIAGFVEVGETLEQTVHREAFEEVGVKLKNLQYVGSQPWPFPSNLMIGFVAEYDSGELVLQEDEIAEAAFFPFDDLPLIPPKGSIAHLLIQHAIGR
jgi:NAD+ diphosphatase